MDKEDPTAFLLVYPTVSLLVLLMLLTFGGALGWIGFNRITSGPKATAWDAVRLNLRVEAQQ